MNKKDKVKSYYNQYASQYDSFYGPIQQLKFLHVRPYLDLDHPYVVDLGGGTGMVSEWISNDLLNLDISYDMLYQGIQTRSFQAVAADLEFLPLRQHAITSLLSLTALQNVSDLTVALTSLFSALEPGAEGVITLLNKTVSAPQVEEELSNLGFTWEKIPSDSEDICYLIRS